VWNVTAIALSAELDLAVVISEVEDDHYDHDQGWAMTPSFAVRPLRFRDGTPHPCAKIATVRFSTTSASISHVTQAQVLGDYLLLWIGPDSREDLGADTLVYLIAWKQGSITLVNINDHLSCICGGKGDDDSY